MDKENVKEKNGNGKNTAIKILLVIAFIAIGYLAYCNYTLKQKVEYYAEISNELHENLYARVDGSYNDGAHILSISDVYYKKYFDKDDK